VGLGPVSISVWVPGQAKNFKTGMCICHKLETVTSSARFLQPVHPALKFIANNSFPP